MNFSQVALLSLGLTLSSVAQAQVASPAPTEETHRLQCMDPFGRAEEARLLVLTVEKKVLETKELPDDMGTEDVLEVTVKGIQYTDFVKSEDRFKASVSANRTVIFGQNDNGVMPLVGHGLDVGGGWLRFAAGYAETNYTRDIVVTFAFLHGGITTWMQEYKAKPQDEGSAQQGKILYELTTWNCFDN